MPHGGGTRAGILPGRPSLDRGNREAEVGFEPRTFRIWHSNLTLLYLLICQSEVSAVDPLQCLVPEKDSQKGTRQLYVEQASLRA
ncbi:hypothetical protein T265_07820 [Opisthorchis viverrini]|uniref:Uncharacterized protein n=1 Tax=Opisthorchis viverrini TaxID=6198 RepID=A0A074ZBM9_OPIVI|nr:hypothetical protein T265_07820 [Opisthorchis viverrini]KER24553.1 hypothetical protein T265_07820 [Opisthorchis viverrini]